MTAHSPFNDRSRRGASELGRWSLLHGAHDAEGERLERYAAEMTARDPMGRKWFVAGKHPSRFVDCGNGHG